MIKDVKKLNDGVCNTYTNFIWEPILVKQNALAAATEAACTILSIDETVRNPKSDERLKEKQAAKMGRGGPKMGGLARNNRLGK